MAIKTVTKYKAESLNKTFDTHKKAHDAVENALADLIRPALWPQVNPSETLLNVMNVLLTNPVTIINLLGDIIYTDE